MIAALILPRKMGVQIERQAQIALPHECCGLIEGTRNGEQAHAQTLHPTPNLAQSAGRFEIDPAEQFRLLRQLRGTDRSLIGCYHSHPGGSARPSMRDIECAGEEDFLWLIAATAEIAAFAYSEGTLRAVPICLA